MELERRPVSSRFFRHPGTGDEALLTVGRVSPDGSAWWWRVALMDDRERAVCGCPAIKWFHAARVGYRDRLRALHAAGWR